MKNKQDKKAKQREKENLSVMMKHKKTKQLAKTKRKNHKFHAKEKFSANEGMTAERIERKVKQLQKVADKKKKGTDNMTLPTESTTLSLDAGHTEKGSKKRKRGKELQLENSSTETPFMDDCSPPAPKKLKEEDDSRLTRKQWRNRKKMEKNSSKKNKFKNLALNKSSNQGDGTRDSLCCDSGPGDLERKHSAAFSVSESLPQTTLSSEKDTHSKSKKKKKSSQLNSAMASSDMVSSSSVVEKLGQSQKSVSLTPVSVTCPKKKQKTKVKYQKEVRKSASPNIRSNTETSDFSYSDSEQSEPETVDYEGSNSHQTSSPGLSSEFTRPDCKFSQKETSSKKTKVVSALDKAHEKLNAARFRYLNEQLYTSTGKEALKMFQEDPEAFDVYHQGFRHQVSQWPVNPLEVIIKQLAKMPKSTTVADFGCGDAQLAESLPENVVHSFDLVSTKPCVTACNIARVPLDNKSVNVAVFCLSLMGTNLSDYLCEANRVLHQGGLLKIAEVISRFYSVSRFVSDVEALGFHLQKKTFLDKMFMMFTFKKVTDCSRKKAPRIQLKACYYKRR